MMPARPIAGRQLGWSAELLRTSPLAMHYRPTMAPISREVCDALAHGALPPELLPTPEQVVHGSALSPLMVTHGYALEPGGGMRVALRTPMPDVSPAMVDWWFGWHSCSPERYKLWHPRAHVHAEWLRQPPPGSEGRARYVGHTSIVDEYVGASSVASRCSSWPPRRWGSTPRGWAKTWPPPCVRGPASRTCPSTPATWCTRCWRCRAGARCARTSGWEAATRAHAAAASWARWRCRWRGACCVPPSATHGRC
ncbi:MAG: hypothetical protein IPG81_15225 [Sandaracinaceae bacterium]|nr:hypothetical protein [Sandaracinaceae bacterium]